MNTLQKIKTIKRAYSSKQSATHETSLDEILTISFREEAGWVISGYEFSILVKFCPLTGIELTEQLGYAFMLYERVEALHKNHLENIFEKKQTPDVEAIFDEFIAIKNKAKEHHLFDVELGITNRTMVLITFNLADQIIGTIALQDIGYSAGQQKPESIIKKIIDQAYDSGRQSILLSKSFEALKLCRATVAEKLDKHMVNFYRTTLQEYVVFHEGKKITPTDELQALVKAAKINQDNYQTINLEPASTAKLKDLLVALNMKKLEGAMTK